MAREMFFVVIARPEITTVLRKLTNLQPGAIRPALPTSNPAQFFQGAPVLHVPDVIAAATFYRDVLGFTWDFGDDTYAVVWRDNSAIHFVRDDRTPDGVHLFQWVRDVDAYYREILEHGAVVASEPMDQPYGIREFGIEDLNGVRIVFGQDIEQD